MYASAPTALAQANILALTPGLAGCTTANFDGQLATEIHMDAIINFVTQYAFFIGIPLLFIGIVIWVFRPSAKYRYQADANLPFYGDKYK